MSEIKIVTHKVNLAELSEMAREEYLDFVKVVADLEREIIAVGGEMHADAERVLLENGSRQDNLWGFNIYPYKPKEQMLEYSSLINIRPRQGNRQMEIENHEIRKKISEIVWKLLDGIS